MKKFTQKYLFIAVVIIALFIDFGFSQPVNAASNPLVKNSLFIQLWRNSSRYLKNLYLENMNPVIISAFVEPTKVTSGDIMTIHVQAKDNFGIQSVVADTDGIGTIKLKRKKGDIYQGVWENKWKVHDTKAKDYTTTIIVTNSLNKIATQKIKWSDPTTVELLTGATQNCQTNSYPPYDTYYQDSIWQSIYLKSDLNNAGIDGESVISEICFNCCEVPGRQIANFRIKMKNTTASSLSNFDTSGLTVVYGPTSQTISATGWVCYTLNPTFTWDGTSNLLVEAYRNDSSWTQGGGNYVRSAASGRGYAGYCDSCSGCGPGEDCYSPSTRSAQSSVLSIKLTYAPVCTDNGESCSVNGDCCSGNCQNGICCEAGYTCCTSDSQCPADTSGECQATDNYCDTTTDHYCKNTVDTWCYRVNSGDTQEIDKWGVCKKVSNNNSLDIFVPANTDTEWTDFRNNASGVTLAECGYYCDEDNDGHYSTTLSSSCPSGRQSSDKGDDCCDSDANAYPGQTDYFDSADACGSFDYDCNGANDRDPANCYGASSCTLSNSSEDCSTNLYHHFVMGCEAPQNCGVAYDRYYCDIHWEYTSDCDLHYWHYDCKDSNDMAEDFSGTWGITDTSRPSVNDTCKCK